MALFSSRDFEELVQLQEFASFLHTGGIIKEQIDQVIQFLKSLNTIDDLKETDSPPLELSSTQKKCVRFEEGSMSSSHDHSVDFKPARIVLLDFGVAPFPAVQINDSMTWNALKMHIEDNIKLLRGHDEFMEVSCVVLRGQHFYTYDNSIISPDVIKDGDILTVEFQTSQTKGISRIISSGVTVRNKFQYLALSVHAFMLERGFFSIVDVVEHPVLAQRPWRSK